MLTNTNMFCLLPGPVSLLPIFCHLSTQKMNLRNWFKGNDTVSLLQFLEKVLPEKCADLALADDETKTLFHQILVAVKAANHFMRTMYHAALWLSVAERRTLIESGHHFIKAFKRCAEICYWNDLTRFKYQPKKHMFGEVLFEMEFQERHDLPSPNPLCWSTQQDEDFVGKICTFSKYKSIYNNILGQILPGLTCPSSPFNLWIFSRGPRLRQKGMGERIAGLLLRGNPNNSLNEHICSHMWQQVKNTILQ